MLADLKTYSVLCRSSSSLSVKEEEDFLLSGKARLRVKSLVREDIIYQNRCFLHIVLVYDCHIMTSSLSKMIRESDRKKLFFSTLS